jgi:type IV pilus assembly protein PilM
MIVDVESYASRLGAQRLVERLPGRGRDVLVALFEIGAMTTSLQVLRNGEVLYERDQAFGGAQLTQQLARQYGFSPEEAEAKKRSGDLPDDYEATVLSPFVDSLSGEVARSLQFFFTSTPHNKVDYIMLAGGTSAIPGLVDKITSQTNVATIIVNPFDGMQIADGVREKKLRREAPSYLTSCGLAMRRFM